jgi:hypothetical protein
MLLNSRSESGKLTLPVAALLLTLAAAAPVCAQSTQANFPTPVFAGEVSGRIAPRDVGDPRRTRHFYTFRGAEGDLVVNLETAELSGDVDVFLAAGFRPLIKFTLFGDPARLSKSFYLRKEETLILRVEARAAGDAEGTYRITFGGSFLPAPPELANREAPEAPTLSSAEPRGTRRVTSTGARIDEPKVEPTPAEETAAAAPTPAPTPAPERATGRRSTAGRRGRNTRTAPPRSRPAEGAAQPTPTQPESTEAKPAEETTAAAPAPTPAPSRRRGTRPPRRNSTRESAGARTNETPAQPPADTQPAPAPAPTQRLVIITKDGEILERDMSAVRRVTVENNQVVVVGRDGRVTRRPLADILKMSIEPQ